MSQSIHVLHTEWSDGWGGQEIRIIEEMCAVRDLGVTVSLACRPEARIREKAREREIPVHTLPFRGNTDLETLWKLIRIIRREKIDIVNTHSGKDTWVGGVAAKLAGAKFIRTRHLSNPINPSRLNFINGLADYIFTTGESVREDMIRCNRIDPKKIASIPTGIDETRFSPACCDREEVRRELGILPGQIVIGNLAVLRSFKRHDLLIEAAETTLKTHPDLLFLIAGEGPQRPKLEESIRDKGLQKHIRLLGHTEKPERFLRALDIFVLSSDSKEGVPQSVIQALMMGLPVIATDVGSTRDLYTGDNLLLLPPGESRKLQQAIESLLCDPDRRRKLAENARSSVRNYRRDLMAEKIYSIYKTLLKADRVR